MQIRYDDQVAIVTGAGNGLGRSHALSLAARGARVVVNDFGGARDGTGGSLSPAQEVVDLINDNGGEAIVDGGNVADYAAMQKMVESALEEWGRVDILVNNAGILRDKSFAKVSMEDFKAVMDVHLYGTVHCCKAVWPVMQEQNYGRIVVTTSSSGMYGNFGQSNYGAAKMAVIGLMNTLVLEGKKYGIHINALSPTAGTRMLEDIIPDQNILDLMSVESVTAGLLTLCDQNAPNRTVLCCGAGGFATTKIFETEGIYLPPEAQTAEKVRAEMSNIVAEEGQKMITAGFEQTNKFVAKAMHFLGINPTS